MRILITGSSGQIGTNLGLDLIGRGHEVVGVDNRPNPWTDAIPTLVHDLSQLAHDFTQGIGSAHLPGGFDVVVHFAAHAKVHELVEDPSRALANIAMTFNVLEYCRAHGLPVIFSSSREVYGDIHRYMTDEASADFAFTESPYSASKIAGEALIYSYAQCYGLRYLVFRFSNVYGRYDTDIERMERVIPLFMSRIGRGLPITIYGADKVLDFTYIDDCVRGVTLGIDLLAGGGEANQTINLAYGEGSSLITLAETIGAELGVPVNMTVRPSRVGEVTHYVADLTKARSLLGYEPRVLLREGIRRAVAWSNSHAANAGDDANP